MAKYRKPWKKSRLKIIIINNGRGRLLSSREDPNMPRFHKFIEFPLPLPPSLYTHTPLLEWKSTSCTRMKTFWRNQLPRKRWVMTQRCSANSMATLATWTKYWEITLKTLFKRGASNNIRSGINTRESRRGMTLKDLESHLKGKIREM